MLSQALTLLLQFSMLSLAMAAPMVSTAGHGNSWAYGTSGGIIGLIVLILDIIVFIEVLKSDRPAVHKLLWCLAVFFFPIVGIVVYWLFSNRAQHNSGYESIA